MFESFDTENTKRVLLLSITKNIDYSRHRRINFDYSILGLSKEDGKPRNVNFANRFYIRDFKINYWNSSDFVKNYGTNKLYFGDFSFKPHSINSEQSTAINKTFKKLNKFEFMTAQELLGLLKKTFKIECVYIYINSTGSYASSTYKIIPIDDFIRDYESFESEHFEYLL